MLVNYVTLCDRADIFQTEPNALSSSASVHVVNIGIGGFKTG